MSFLSRIFGRPQRQRTALRPLYDAVVAEARQPAWYLEGGVPDTLDGRFEVLSSVLTAVLLRLEGEADQAKRESVLLTEIFIDDMDAVHRQLGIGDLVVGKRVSKIMGALGGRLGAFREAFAESQALDVAVRKNVFRDSPPSEAALRFVADRLRSLHATLAGRSLATIMQGEISW